MVHSLIISQQQTIQLFLNINVRVMSQIQMPLRAQPFSDSGKNIQKPLKTKTQFDYKGITLKQYFRLQTQESYFQQQDKIDELEQESSCFENNVETPSFKQVKQKIQPPPQTRRKIKTQIQQEQSFMYKKSSNPGKISKNDEKNQSYIYFAQGDKSVQNKQLKYKSQNKKNNHKNSLHKQRIGSIPDSETKKQDQNRSTLTSFYQQEKKNKMLKKIKQDKQKVKELQISDAFFITKYAKKFHMEANDVSN